jgi:hypothetical protein
MSERDEDAVDPMSLTANVISAAVRDGRNAMTRFSVRSRTTAEVTVDAPRAAALDSRKTW